jgi:RHS repeat-associated protein
VVNEAGRHYIFNYNKRGEVISETGFGGRQSIFERDSSGRIIKSIRPGGGYTQYEYDVNGRVISVKYNDGSWELFSYDRNGNLKEASNEHAHVQLSRNKMGYLEREQQDEYVVQRRYNKSGDCIQIASNLGAEINLQHDSMGQITHMQATQQHVEWEAQFKYNKADRELERLLPGGIINEWQYNVAGQPVEHRVIQQGAMQSWKKYSWSASHRLTNIFDAIAQGSTHFKHDALGSLVFAQYADNSIVHRATDATGNIYETTTKSDRVYDNADALLESSKYLYKYDEEGKLISKTEKATLKKTRFEWYANGRLKKVLLPNGREVTFTYDALGRRVSKNFNGVITRWVYDGDRPLHEWSYPEKEKPQQEVNEWGQISYNKQEPNPANDADKVNGITWIFELNSHRLAARLGNNMAWSVITDHLGTPQWMYDATGKKVWAGVLDIYGRVRNLHGSSNNMPFRFQGQYEDVETGLYYNRFRYYDVEAGRYISPDPVGLEGGMALYGYVKDPNSWVDVLGLNECTPNALQRRQIQELRSGQDVVVRDAKEARALLDFMPELRPHIDKFPKWAHSDNIQGNRFGDLWKQPPGTYRGDLFPLKKGLYDDGVIHHSSSVSHDTNPHYNLLFRGRAGKLIKSAIIIMP